MEASLPLARLVTIPILTTLLLASMLCINQANAAPDLETLLSFMMPMEPIQPLM